MAIASLGMRGRLNQSANKNFVMSTKSPSGGEGHGDIVNQTKKKPTENNVKNMKIEGNMNTCRTMWLPLSVMAVAKLLT